MAWGCLLKLQSAFMFGNITKNSSFNFGNVTKITEIMFGNITKHCTFAA